MGSVVEEELAQIGGLAAAHELVEIVDVTHVLQETCGIAN